MRQPLPVHIDCMYIYGLQLLLHVPPYYVFLLGARSVTLHCVHCNTVLFARFVASLRML
jgi:hypothetical protein